MPKVKDFLVDVVMFPVAIIGFLMVVIFIIFSWVMDFFTRPFDKQ